MGSGHYGGDCAGDYAVLLRGLDHHVPEDEAPKGRHFREPLRHHSDDAGVERECRREESRFVSIV